MSFVAKKVCLPRQNFCLDKIVCSDISLAGGATSIFFVATTTCLSRQKYACRDEFCRDKSMLVVFVVTKLLSRQAYFCHDKHVFVETKYVFCRDKSMLVATKLLSRQAYFCHDKHVFVETKYVHLFGIGFSLSLICQSTPEDIMQLAVQ